MLRLTKLNTKQKCAKIGSSMVSVVMGKNASLLMATLRWSTKNHQMRNINQNLASHSMKEASVHMENVAYLNMRIDHLRKYQAFTMFTSYRLWNTNLKIQCSNLLKSQKVIYLRCIFSYPHLLKQNLDQDCLFSIL